MAIGLQGSAILMYYTLSYLEQNSLQSSVK